MIERPSELGISLTVLGDKLRYSPMSRTPPELVEQMRRHKEQLISLFGEAGCRNSLTPHEAHIYPWGCDSESCYCFREFGQPRFCQGVPCRWVWPNGHKAEA